MKKTGNGFSIVKLIINTVCFFIAGCVILALISLGAIDQIKQALPVYIGIVVILAGIPALMAFGNRMIIKEDEKISLQAHFNKPVSFIKKNVILGYVIMFFPLYLFILATLLIPFESAWAIFLIPASVITFVLAKLKGEMLSSFKISKRKYTLCHFGAYAASVIMGALLRFTVIIPWMEVMNA